MSFYNTGNPVPSIDPRDLDDNAKHIDEIASSTSPTFVDRLGVTRRTFAGIEADADQILLRSDLANSTDPTKGAGLVGWTRSLLSKTITRAHQALDVLPVSPWERADLAIGYNPATDYRTWDWRPAIQWALDYCAANDIRYLYIPSDFTVSLDPTAPGVANAYSSGGVALSIKSPIKIFGPGSIKLKSGEGHSDCAIFGNPHVTTISGRVEIAIEVNGNSANTLGTVSGILLVGVLNPVFPAECYSHDVTRHGIMCRPNPSQLGMTDTVMEVQGARVANCGNIGIQGTRVKEFILTGCHVTNTTDNCIDVYGNDTAGGSSEGFVGKCIITGAILDTGPTGIFIESFSNWQIFNNTFNNCNGIKVNRINSGALQGNIKNNTFTGNAALTTSYGISIANSSGRCHINGNFFDRLQDAITCGSGTTHILVGDDNTHRRIRRYFVNHNGSANQLVQSTILDQRMYEDGLTLGLPQLTPPTDHPLFTTSESNVFRGNIRTINNNVSVPNNFEQSTTVLTSPGAWGGEFSLYNIGSDGETRINTSPDIAGLPKYVTISGIAYFVLASGTSGEYYVRLWNGTTAVAGNYKAALNSALTVSVKYDAFATA